MRLSEALASYVVQLAADGRSPHTIAQATRHGRLLVAALEDPEASAVTHALVARFLASEVVTRSADGSPRAASSANALRSSVRCLFAYLHAAGFASSNAARLVRRARVPPPRPRAVPEGDVERLLATLAKARTQAEIRDRMLYLVMLRGGLRVGSAVALDASDLGGDQLTLRRMKGGDQDVAFVPPDVAALLAAYLDGRTTGPMFPRTDGGRLGVRQVNRRLAEWAERSGIFGPVSPHRLRHSFGMAVYARCGDLLATSRAMCHRSVSSTATYARPSEARVRAAIAG